MKATQKTDDIGAAQQYGKWMRLAIWYKNVPILKHVNPLFLLMILYVFLLILFIKPSNCTCEDQYPDQELSTLAKEGDEKVAAHLSARDNALLCESRRQELLKELERKSIGSDVRKE
ncbi:MAG: hypothetical protein EOO10_25380 [Chitinophagaceae bacterium]|nr:MAG: hypothetical protein EOO10_25380 [Chitinophagaceae bacterium]